MSAAGLVALLRKWSLKGDVLHAVALGDLEKGIPPSKKIALISLTPL
ncbi:hypothetical protein ACC862_23950 [Rhizobium ruizarguesonis]